MLPDKDKLSICFAHVAYRLHERFSALGTGIGSFAVRDAESLEARIGEADVLVDLRAVGQRPARPRDRSCASSSRSAPAPTSFRATSWPGAASAWPAPAASMPAPSPSTRWR